jgi:hypothetical protein
MNGINYNSNMKQKKTKKLNELAKILVTLTCAKESFEYLKSTNQYILEEILRETRKEIQKELKKLKINQITLNPTGNREITLKI